MKTSLQENATGRPPEAPPNGRAARWERERDAAMAALLRAGASEREARVLGSQVAHAAGTLALTGSWRGDAPAVTLRRAAVLVLEAHRRAVAEAGVTP
jgi:hypothetical protein